MTKTTDMPFKKGKSGNPKGRPPKVTEQSLIDSLSPLDDLAFEKLQLALQQGEQWAVKLFFEYRYGKPKQRTELTGKDGDPLTPFGSVIEIDLNKYIE